MTAFQAVLQALLGRAKTGEGRHISVSLFHALSDWMNVPYLQYVYGGKVPARAGLNHPTIAPYGAYACADGKAILFSIQNEREWGRFLRAGAGGCRHSRDSRFAGNSLRVEHRAALDGLINAVFGAHSRETMVARWRPGGSPMAG